VEACPLKNELLESHNDAVAEWTRLAGSHMTAYHSGDKKAASLPLSQAEDARIKAEQTREALRGHIADHAC
jgi:hypothetical protein